MLSLFQMKHRRLTPLFWLQTIQKHQLVTATTEADDREATSSENKVLQSRQMKLQLQEQLHHGHHRDNSSHDDSSIGILRWKRPKNKKSCERFSRVPGKNNSAERSWRSRAWALLIMTSQSAHKDLLKSRAEESRMLTSSRMSCN